MTERVVVTDLVRSVPFELRADGDPGDGLTLDGYAAVFDSPTRIDSYEGTFDETIARGAFRKTIRERTPVLQFDHGRHPMVGSVPLGSVESLAEDNKGLHVLARLHENWLVEPIREAIASRSINGMSFRFVVVKDEWRDANGKRITDPDEIRRRIYTPDEDGVLMRTLRELKVPELGPVVFPAYTSTSVAVRDALVDPDFRAKIVDLARLLESTSQDDVDDAGREAADGTEPGDHSAHLAALAAKTGTRLRNERLIK